MTAWQIVLLASIACLLLKELGYLVPASLLERPTPARVADLLTVALLGALTLVQTFSTGSDIVLDARAPALGLAAVLYALKVPFIVVVLAAAATAALIRLATGT